MPYQATQFAALYYQVDAWRPTGMQVRGVSRRVAALSREEKKEEETIVNVRRCYIYIPYLRATSLIDIN